MKGPALLGILLAMAAAAAQPPPTPGPAPAPGLAVLLFHPFPDAADPLGFAFPDGASRDAFAARHGRLAADGGAFPYPYAVVDGIHPVAGLPDPQRPYLSAYDAYADAVRARADAAPPARMQVAAEAAGTALDVQVTVEPTAPVEGASLRLWVAVAEDHVAYRPPPALSNGVFDHRFTVRALRDAGAIDLSPGAAVARSVPFALEPRWAPERLLVVAWLQQEAVDGRFAAHEVAQSAIHPVAAGGATRQEGKGVLLEVLSATWCDTCLYGDEAAADLAAAHGVPDLAPAAETARYLRAPNHPAVAAAAALLAGAGLFAASRRAP